MQTLRDIGTKFHNLSVNTTSKHPTAEDSAQIDTTLFEEGDVSPSPRSREKEHKLITNVIVKHSSAFNSERASGMNKLQQLQFIEALKKIILDEAALTHGASKRLLVSTSRSTEEGHAFGSTAAHTAILLDHHSDGETWTVLEKSDECEYLVDAMETLWERVLTRAGKLTGDLSVGDRVLREEEVERLGSGDTLVVSDR